MAIGEEPYSGHGERRRRSPESLRLRAVMPMLLVSDLERSLAWYTDILGFIVAEELRQNGTLVAVRLKAGKVQFLLEQDADRRPDRPRSQSIRLCCATRQDVHKLAAAIQTRGGAIQEAPDDAHGGQDFAVVDPDGYTISIFWRPERQP
jgi:catechol 2,3-dioxygenase-like lactoylglutathione lyase family enzyme